MFERILVPYDGGQSAQIALEQALSIAQRHGGVIHGLTVFDPMPYTAEPLLTDLGSGLNPQPADLSLQTELLSAAEQAAKENLSRLEKRCQEAGVRCVAQMRTGEVTTQVLEAAHQADLMVLARPAGAPQPRRLEEAWVRRSPVPVWLAVEAPDEPEQILLAYDGGIRADDALRVAARLAQSWGLPLALRVVREEGRVDQSTLQQAEGLLHELNVDPVSAELLSGKPGEVLVSLTRPRSVLVMGTHGHGAFLGLRFGRTVDEVVRGGRGALLICP